MRFPISGRSDVLSLTARASNFPFLHKDGDYYRRQNKQLSLLTDQLRGAICYDNPDLATDGYIPILAAGDNLSEKDSTVQTLQVR